PRREGNVRLYSPSDRARVAAILAGKRLGFTLAEIRDMIAGSEGGADSLKVTKEKCLEQIHMLEKQQLNIKHALAELWRIHAGLPAEIIQIDWNETAPQSGPPHVGGIWSAGAPGFPFSGRPRSSRLPPAPFLAGRLPFN